MSVLLFKSYTVQSNIWSLLAFAIARELEYLTQHSHQQTGPDILEHYKKRSIFIFSYKLRHITKTCPCNIQRIFSAIRIENFTRKKIDIFNIFAQNIHCGYTLETPRRGGSNDYPQCMFWIKNKKNRYTPAYPSFAI